MKKIFTFGTAVVLSLTSVTAFANNHDDVRVPMAPSVSSVYHQDEPVQAVNERSFKNASAETILTRLKAQGEKIIKERIQALQSNKTVIEANKTLTEAQRNTLVTKITTNVNGLNSLQTQITQAVDATSTKALISSVYTNFRIYGIVIPSVRLEKRIYDLQNHVSTLDATFKKVEDKIKEVESKGKDVTEWQKRLTDAKALVVKDTALLSSSLLKVNTLTPSLYGTTSKAIIQEANTTIKTVSKDFATIKKELKRPSFMKDRKDKKEDNKKVLSNTSWVWTSLTDNGTTTVPKTDKLVLTFGGDNRVSSKTDCNSLGGSYLAGTSSLSFGPLMMTRMFCEGSQEGVYAAALNKVKTFTIVNDILTLGFDNGIMTFKKK